MWSTIYLFGTVATYTIHLLYQFSSFSLMKVAAPSPMRPFKALNRPPGKLQKRRPKFLATVPQFVSYSPYGKKEDIIMYFIKQHNNAEYTYNSSNILLELSYW